MEEGRWGTLLAALLCREGTVWEIVDEMGGIRPVGSDTAGLEEMLRTDPALVLRGKGPRGEVWEVRLAGEAPVISRATLPSLYDGGELRPESVD
ncbi:MAG: hypothetical protein GX493_01835, partial [Firmicutes bacterium]|nr:hypothetical protein [Bacillota bacterium]